MLMKVLWIVPFLVAGNAMACPGEGSKDAMAPAALAPLFAKHAAPMSTPVPVAATATPKKAQAVKVSDKAEPAPRKAAPL
jgi:hypothetical protein